MALPNFLGHLIFYISTVTIHIELPSKIIKSSFHTGSKSLNYDVIDVNISADLDCHALIISKRIKSAE